MFRIGGPIAIPCLSDWRDALGHNGANQVIQLRRLFETYPISTLVPDQSIIYGSNPEGSEHILAAVSAKGSWVMVYLSMGQPVKVVMNKLADPVVSAKWFNPRNGEYILVGEFTNLGIREFIPPSSGIDNDWVLILE